MTTWTKDQQLADLQEFHDFCRTEELAPTRNRYREFTSIPRSDMESTFGTWAEFQRQAGFKPRQAQTQIDNAIAKHSSRDAMEVFGQDRIDYQGKYLKPTDKRWRTVLVGSDFHDIDCDPFVRRLFIETAQRVQPDCIFLNGDMIDLPEFGKYDVDPRTWGPMQRIGWLHEFLGDVRKAAPNAELIYLEGNHENRLLRHLAEATPALKTILHDLHGFTMPKLLGLDQFEVNYVGKADLRAWTNRDTTKELHKNNYFLWDMLLGDHFPNAIHQGIPGWNGHHHRWNISPLYSRQYGSSMWVQLAGGHVANAEYCEGEKWNTGFMLVHADTHTKRSVFEIIDVRDFAIVGGQHYTRQESERWHKKQMVYS